MAVKRPKLIFREAIAVSALILSICLLLLTQLVQKVGLGVQPQSRLPNLQDSSAKGASTYGLRTRHAFRNSPDDDTVSISSSRSQHNYNTRRRKFVTKRQNRTRSEVEFSNHTVISRNRLRRRQPPQGRPRRATVVGLVPPGEQYRLEPIPESDPEYRRSFYSVYGPQGYIFPLSQQGIRLDFRVRRAIRNDDDDSVSDPIPFNPRTWETPFYKLECTEYDDADDFARYSDQFWASSPKAVNLMIKMFKATRPNNEAYRAGAGREALARDYRFWQIRNPEYFWSHADVNWQDKAGWDEFKEEQPDEAEEMTRDIEAVISGMYSRKDRTLVIQTMYKEDDLVPDDEPMRSYISDLTFSAARNLRDDDQFWLEGMKREDKIPTDIEYIFIDSVVNDETKAVIVWAFTVLGIPLARRSNIHSVVKFSYNDPDNALFFTALLRTPNIAPFLRSFEQHHRGWRDLEIMDIFVNYRVKEGDLKKSTGTDTWRRWHDIHDGWHLGDAYIGIRLGRRTTRLVSSNVPSSSATQVRSSTSATHTSTRSQSSVSTTSTA